jgi:hypothetical protein
VESEAAEGGANVKKLPVWLLKARRKGYLVRPDAGPRAWLENAKGKPWWRVWRDDCQARGEPNICVWRGEKHCGVALDISTLDFELSAEAVSFLYGLLWGFAQKGACITIGPKGGSVSKVRRERAVELARILLGLVSRWRIGHKWAAKCAATARAAELQEPQAGARAAVRQTVATRRCERRLSRILRFVAYHAVPQLELLRGGFRPLGGRIRWADMAKRRSQANPQDPLKPGTLRRYYLRARVHPRVGPAYLEQVRQRWVRTGKRVGPLAAATEEEGDAGSKSRRGNRSRS